MNDIWSNGVVIEKVEDPTILLFKITEDWTQLPENIGR